MLLNPKPALSCSIASLPCVAQSQQCPKLLNPTLPYIAQSQPCFTLLNTNPCSFPVSCKTARCSVGSMEVWQGKRISRKAAGSTAPPLKKAPSKADVTWMWLLIYNCAVSQLRMCAVILPFNHTSPSHNAVSIQGQIYTQPFNMHRRHCSDTLQLFSTLKRAHSLYVALKGNHYCNWHLLVTTACFELHAAWGSCNLY